MQERQDMRVQNRARHIDNPYPAASKVSSLLLAAGIGVLEQIPGLGVAGAVIDEAMRLAQRERDADWAALVGARLASLEDSGRQVDPSSPHFLAAVARLHRSAQETADAGKRQLLAAAAANASQIGEFTELEEFVELVAELRTHHVALLAFFADPFGSTAREPEEGIYISSWWGKPDWAAEALDLDPSQYNRLCQVLELRMLIRLPFSGDASTEFGSMRSTTDYGRRFLSFLRSD